MWDSVTPWTIAHHAPLSMGFSRQEYWRRLPFLSPGDLPDPGIKSTSLSLTGRFSFLNLFIFAVMGLCCCVGLVSIYREQGLLFLAVHRFLIVVVSLLEEHGL